jgi:tetratricopeptide (TPR) repeat protein
LGGASVTRTTLDIIDFGTSEDAVMIKRVSTAVATVFVASLLLGVCGGAWAATPIARIAGVVENGRPVTTSSTAQVFRAAAKEGVAAAAGLTLFEKDEIRTGKALLRIEYTDGTGDLLIQAGTHLRLLPRSPKSAKGVGVTVGEVVSTVKQQFSVIGNGVNGAVEGTQFDVRVTPERTVITVLEGTVRASTTAGLVRVRALETTEGRAGRALPVPTRATEAELSRIVEWTSGLAVFTHSVVIVKPQYPDAAARSAEYKTAALAVVLNPRDVAAHRRLGQVYMDWGKAEEALGHFRAALQEAPDDAMSLHGIGLVRAQRGEHAMAVKHFEDVLRRNPTSAVAHSNLGLSLNALGSYEAAMQAFERAAQLRPDLADAYVNQGMAHLSRNRPAQAIIPLEKAIALEPQSAPALNNLADAYFKVNAYDKAARAFQRAIELDPSFAAPRQNLGVLLMHQGRLDEAQQMLEAAVQLAPSLASIWNNLGAVQLGREQPREAAVHFRKALSLDPNNAEARMNLGIALFRQDQFDAALDEFRASATLAPDSRPVYENIGHAALKLGRPVAALAAYEKALALGAPQATVHFGLGNAYAGLRDYQQAIAQYAKAEAIQPSHVGALANRGWMHYLRGEYDASLAATQRATVLAPDDPRGWYNTGFIQLRRGDLDASMAAFEQAFTKDSGRRFVGDAVAELAQAAKENPGLRGSQLVLGALHMHAARQPAAAIQALEKFLKDAPSDKWSDDARARLRRLTSSAR